MWRPWIASRLAPPATRSTSTSAPTTRCCASSGRRPRARVRGGAPVSRDRACTSAPRSRSPTWRRSPTAPAAFPTACRRSGASCSARASRSSSRPGYPIDTWQGVRTRGRRRPLRWDGEQHPRGVHRVGVRHRRPGADRHRVPDRVEQAPRAGWSTDAADGRRRRRGTRRRRSAPTRPALARLRGALGPRSNEILRDMIEHDCDLFVRLLDGSFREYQRSAQRWWQRDRARRCPPSRPVYFVSSNSHSLANLLGGYARAHREAIVDVPAPPQPRGSRAALRRGDRRGRRRARDQHPLLLAARVHPRGRSDRRAHRSDDRMAQVQQSDAASGHPRDRVARARSTSTRR